MSGLFSIGGIAGCTDGSDDDGRVDLVDDDAEDDSPDIVAGDEEASDTESIEEGAEDEELTEDQHEALDVIHGAVDAINRGDESGLEARTADGSEIAVEHAIDEEGETIEISTDGVIILGDQAAVPVEIGLFDNRLESPDGSQEIQLVEESGEWRIVSLPPFVVSADE